MTPVFNGPLLPERTNDNREITLRLPNVPDLFRRRGDSVSHFSECNLCTIKIKYGTKKFDLGLQYLKLSLVEEQYSYITILDFVKT